MSREQLAECDKLQNFFENYILKEYSFKTIYHMIVKKKTGYCFLRICRNNASRWYLRINVFSGECNIRCKPIESQFIPKPKSGRRKRARTISSYNNGLFKLREVKNSFF